MNSLLPNSLAFRLLAITATWTIFALIITGLLLSAYFRQNTERDFQSLLLAHTYNLMGAIDADDLGKISGAPNLGDPRFLQPLSGWYWSVATANNPGTPLLHSDSIGGDELEVPSEEQKPFNDEFQRLSEVTDEAGNSIQRLEAQLLVGDSGTLFQVMVAGNKRAVESAVEQFQRTLVLFFCLFGLGTILATYFVIRFGLRPLTKAAESLHDVREGRVETLQGEFPDEIQPLANEINALINANKSVVERARTQVGNLAHALKTPLAVIMNETRKPDKSTAETISEQAQLMRSQVQTYLDRARIAAQRGVPGGRVEIEPVLERMLRVMTKLNPSIDFELKVNAPKLSFKGEEQDLEEAMGNLLENASRFSNGVVQVEAIALETQKSVAAQIQITVDDDGSGLSKEERDQALLRGIRLDETQPGSGLGLSIVRDIVSEYGGDFQLQESDLGGLRAVLILPRVTSK